MLTLEKRIQQWKQWVNRNKQFSTEELEELENHLREEILYLTEHDNIPNQKAFDQALDILGEKGLLDEEFGKIRKSKFDKVKLWAYGQTLVIVGLVIVLTVPYIYIQKNVYTGELIGSIGQWSKEMPEFGIQNIVLTSGDEILFHEPYENNIYSYKKILSQHNPTYRLNGTYFSTSTYINSPITLFDIDSQGRVYCLNYFNYMINFYYQGLLEKSLPLPYPKPDEKSNESEYFLNYIVGLKVVENKLIVCLYEAPKSNGQSNLNHANCYLEVYELNNSKFKLLDKIKLKNQPISMDRSDNEISVLSTSGIITTYFLQKDKLKLLQEFKIENPEPIRYLSLKYFYPLFTGFSTSLLFCKKNNQMVVKDNMEPNSYYYLLPQKNGNLRVVPIADKNVAGVIKINYQNEERLVLVKKDKKEMTDGQNNLYLFKD